MRLTTTFFVSALLRRVNGTGGFGAVLRRGNDEAGAILLVLRGRDGRLSLYGPAPQSAYAPGTETVRRFICIQPDLDGEELERRIDRQASFDPDLWAVEIEPGSLAISDLVSLAEPDQ